MFYHIFKTIRYALCYKCEKTVLLVSAVQIPAFSPPAPAKENFAFFALTLCNMHDARGTVFAKQDARSMWLKLFIIKLNESKFTNVSCYNVTRQRRLSQTLLTRVMFQLFLKTHIRHFMLTIVSIYSVAAFDQIFR